MTYIASVSVSEDPVEDEWYRAYAIYNGEVSVTAHARTRKMAAALALQALARELVEQAVKGMAQ